MKTRWLGLAAAGTLTMIMPGGCSAPVPGPTVTDAWVRLPAVPGRPGAAYAKVAGRDDYSVMLKGISSPQAARGELHLNVVENGRILSMRPIAEAPVPARTTLYLQPASAHVMLFGLSGDLKPGGTIPLTFDFGESKRTVDAKLVGAGDPAPE